MGRLKNIVIGEPMPDKNDPKYRERYEREVEAGKKFAQKSGISWGARKVQEVGQTNKVAFLACVFGFVLVCFALNVFRLLDAYQQKGKIHAVAVERVDSALKSRQHVEESINFEVYEED